MRRTNSPLKTAFLLALLGVATYLAYDCLVVRKVLAGDAPPPKVTEEQRDEIREALLAYLDKEPCFLELGLMVYRARENKWRIDIVVPDSCSDEARHVCRRAVEMVTDAFSVDVSVWAYDGAGREVAHFIP